MPHQTEGEPVRLVPGESVYERMKQEHISREYKLLMQISDMQKQEEVLRGQLAEARQQNVVLRGTIENLQYLGSEELVSGLNDKLSAAAPRLAELEDALLDEERKCIDLELECDGLQDQLDDAPLEPTDAKDYLDEAAEKQLAEARLLLRDAEGRECDLAIALDGSRASLADAQKSNAHWHQRVTSLLNDQDAWAAKLEAAEEQLAEARQRIAELEKLVPDAALMGRLAADTNERCKFYELRRRYIEAQPYRDDCTEARRLRDAIHTYREATDAKD